MMKRFIPDVENNVLCVDSNGITKIDHCESMEECFHMCDGLNGAEKNDRMANNKHNSAGSRA